MKTKKYPKKYWSSREIAIWKITEIDKKIKLLKKEKKALEDELKRLGDCGNLCKIKN